MGSFVDFSSDGIGLDRIYVGARWLLPDFFFGFTEFYWVLMDSFCFFFIGFLLGLTRRTWIFLGFTGFY